MPRALVPSLLLLAFVAGACARQRPPLVVAMEPRPNPPVGASRQHADTPRERLRQNRWLAQFWEELTPAQRRRVEARMRRSQPPIAADQESAQSAWDTLGLAERDRLVFGGAGPVRPAAAAAGTSSSAAAGAEGAQALPTTP